MGLKVLETSGRGVGVAGFGDLPRDGLGLQAAQAAGLRAFQVAVGLLSLREGLLHVRPHQRLQTQKQSLRDGESH